MNANLRLLTAKQAGKTQVPIVTYFVEAEGTDMVKIGGTVDMKARLSSMRCNCPVRLRLLAVCDLPERIVQGRFRSAHSHGEWFKLTDEIKDFIAANTETENQMTRGVA